MTMDYRDVTSLCMSAVVLCITFKSDKTSFISTNFRTVCGETVCSFLAHLVGCLQLWITHCCTWTWTSTVTDESPCR